MRSEYEIKAAFLLNFAKFVEFPAGSFAAPDDPLLIGVLGRDPFGSALSNVVLGKIVDRHKINIVRQPSSGSIPPCHILFVSKSESGNLRQTLDQLRGKNVLTVGDSDDFVKSGGMIRLYVEDDRVRFEINPQAAERAGLRISSRLLALARVVAADSGGARN